MKLKWELSQCCMLLLTFSTFIAIFSNITLKQRFLCLFLQDFQWKNNATEAGNSNSTVNKSILDAICSQIFNLTSDIIDKVTIQTTHNCWPKANQTCLVSWCIAWYRYSYCIQVLLVARLRKSYHFKRELNWLRQVQSSERPTLLFSAMIYANETIIVWHLWFRWIIAKLTKR